MGDLPGSCRALRRGPFRALSWGWMLNAADIAPDRARPLKREEYELLVEHGHFDDEHVELLEGVIVEMSPQGAVHANVVERLTRLLVLALSGRALVRTRSSFATGDASETEPDIAVVRPARKLTDPHPSEAFLVVEVAQSSLAKDRGPKSRLYAHARIGEYWIVDLQSMEIEVRTQPGETDYEKRVTARMADVLHPTAFPDVAIRVAEVLG